MSVTADWNTSGTTTSTEPTGHLPPQCPCERRRLLNLTRSDASPQIDRTVSVESSTSIAMRLTCMDAVFGAHSVASDDALDPIITPAEITETVGWLCSPGALEP